MALGTQKLTSPKGAAKSVLKKAAISALVPVLIVILPIIFLVLIVMVIAGKATTDPNFAAQNGLGYLNPTPQGIAPPTPTPEPGVNPGDKPTLQEFLTYYSIKQCSRFGCSQATQSQIDFVYSRLSIPLESTKYKQLLTTKGKITIYLWPPPTNIGCAASGGAEYGGSLIQYWGYLQPCLPVYVTQWSMIHETGHIIRIRNWSLNSTFDPNELAKQDPQCYEKGSDGYYLKTYAYRSPATGGGYLSESLAEGIGMNTTCGPRLTCGKHFGASEAITNYPGYCPNTYKWIKDNIYGGVDFFGL